MRKALTMALAIIIEASLFMLAELIMKGSKRNGSLSGLHRGDFGRPDGLRGASHSLHAWRGVRDEYGRRRSIS